MRIAMIVDPHNTFLGSVKRFKKDGNEFDNQAKNLALEYTSRGNTVELYRLPKGNAYFKRKALYEAFSEQLSGYFDRIFFFMHGAPKNLNRKMIQMSDVKILGNYLFARTDQRSKIILFSCLCGNLKDPRGFAYQLRDYSMRTVMSHVKRGHTTQNWSKRVFMATGQIRDCFPASTANRKAFTNYLKDPTHLYLWVEMGFSRYPRKAI